jgi:ketosteroid isomerase-like protein
MVDAGIGRVRALYEALANSDITAYLAGLRDDVTFHVDGRSPIAGDYHGKDAVIGLGLRVLDETGGTFRTELREALGNARFVVTLHRWSAERGGAAIEMDNFNIYRLDSDGLVAERWELIEDQDRHDAFWA